MHESILGVRSSEKEMQSCAEYNSNLVERLLKFQHMNGEKEMHPNIKRL